MQKITFKIGNRINVEVSGETPLDIFPTAAFWLSLPTQCPKCQADLILDYKTPKTFKYYVVRCVGETSHAVNLGQKQLDGSLYYDARKPWELWRPGQTEDDAAEHAQADAAPQHANAPDGERGKLIKQIHEQKNACQIRGIVEAERVNLNKVGGLTIDELRRCSTWLANLMNPPKPTV